MQSNLEDVAKEYRIRKCVWDSESDCRQCQAVGAKWVFEESYFSLKKLTRATHTLKATHFKNKFQQTNQYV